MADNNVELSTLGSVIKQAYEGQPNTNAFTDDEKSKLAATEILTSSEKEKLEETLVFTQGEKDKLEETEVFTEEEKDKLGETEVFTSKLKKKLNASSVTSFYMPKVAIVGDSITRQNNDIAYSSNSSRLNDESRGFMTWLQFYSKQAFNFRLTPGSYDFPNGTINPVTSGNFGVSGDDTAGLLARIQGVVDYAPDIVLLCIGTNDISSASKNYDTIVQNMTGIINALTDAGILVIWSTINPRSYWGSLNETQIASRKAVMMRVNDFIKNYPSRTGNKLVVPVDTWDVLCDKTNANGDPIAGALYDGIHFGTIGGRLWGKKIWDVTKKYILDIASLLPMSQIDIYNDDNPRGNLLTNGLMIGNSGAKGTDVTGDVATGWSCTRSGGAGTISAVCSKGSTALDGTAGTFQRITVTATGTGDSDDSIAIRQTTNISSNFTAGDIVVAGCRTAWSDVTGVLREAKVALEVFDSVANQYTISFLDQFSEIYPFTNNNEEGVMYTQPFMIPATATAINIRYTIRFDNTVSGGGKFDIGNAFIRKVIL